MRFALIPLLALLAGIPAETAPRRPSHPDAGGVLKHLSIASFGGSGETSMQAVATDPSGNIYVAGTTSSADLPVKNAVQPEFGESSILRSTDLGATWIRVGGPPGGAAAVIPDPTAPQVLFTAGQAGTYRSADGGRTWQLLNGAAANSLVVDPGNRLRLAALISRGLIRSLDGGVTWTAGGSPCIYGDYCPGSLRADPNGSGTLLAFGYMGLTMSRDWGVTFQTLDPGLRATPTVAAFVPSRPGWIYAAGSMGVMGSLALSKDYGASWTAKNTPPTIFSMIQTLVVDPDQPDTLVASTPDGLYKSSDSAVTWTHASGALPPLDAQSAFAILAHSCAPAGSMFAVTSGIGTFGIAFSPDYGNTWGPAKLTKVTSVVAGPGCAAYVTRQTTTDAFVAKLAPDGTEVWATFLGGSDQDAPIALALDSRGNAYVTGNTASPDFPLTVPRIGMSGQSAVFVTKFSPEGRIDYSALAGGESSNTASGIAVDAGGNAYVAGHTNSQKFPITPGALVTKLDSYSYTGFVLKLSPNANLVYSTFLGESYTFPGAVLVGAEEQVFLAGTGPVPGLPAPVQGSLPGFVMKLDRSGSRVVSSTYLPGLSSGLGPTALAFDGKGDVLVAQSGWIVKVGGIDFMPAPMAAIPASDTPIRMAVDGAGSLVLGFAAGAGFPLRNPILGGPTCGGNSSALLKLSAGGSTELATYLDACGVPGIALAPDGSLIAGVSPSRPGNLAGVLRLPISKPTAVSLYGVANAFSGDPSAVVPGGLYTLTGTGFQAPAIDPGLKPGRPLPLELGGIQVRFDGVPAAILRTFSGQVTAVAPSELPAPGRDNRIPGFTTMQLIANGVASNPVWMPVAAIRPGLLRRDYPDLDPYSDFPDGLVFNADGTANDLDHPAAAGSTITVYVTGMGAIPGVNPASIATSPAVAPVTTVYGSWKRGSPGQTVPPESVYFMPGYVSSMLQIRMVVPDQVYGIDAGNGVKRVALGLNLTLSYSSSIPPVSNLIGVYVK